jgi:hypothetical protein
MLLAMEFSFRRCAANPVALISIESNIPDLRGAYPEEEREMASDSESGIRKPLKWTG